MSAASPLPPNFAFPKFDATLGALYVGSGVATVLYGVSCLQTFIYLTAPRTAMDKPWLRYFVILLFWQLEDLEAQKCSYMLASVFYDIDLRLTTDEQVESLLLACISVMIQMFFCWRIWIFSAASFGLKSRIACTIVPAVLALFSFGSYVDLAINGFNHRILTGNTPDFVQAFKLATSGQIAYDVIVTVLMTWSLQRARVGVKRTDNILTLITLFTINTNLLTTVLAIVGLVTFLALPRATVYGGVGFLLGKTYFNSFLAVLNAREYLREKFDNNTPSIVHPEFVTGPNQSLSGQSSTGLYELSTTDHQKLGLPFTTA